MNELLKNLEFKLSVLKNKSEKTEEEKKMEISLKRRIFQLKYKKSVTK